MPFVRPSPIWVQRHALCAGSEADNSARPTILKDGPSPAAVDAEALALSALGWVLGEETRAQRLLALTGLTPEALRQGLGDRAVLAAVLDFIAGHEPDLVAAAEALGVAPREFARAAESLAR